MVPSLENLITLSLAVALTLPSGCHGFFLEHIFGSGYRVGDEYYDVCQDTCRLTLSCWLQSGQVVKGHLCGSSFHVCCAETNTAKARKINSHWQEEENSLE